jgi:Ca2+-binding RTX toxin-like protein
MNISPIKKIALIIGLMLGHQVVLAGDKTVDGGPGTNTLVITASGVNDLSYFPTINLTDSTLTLTDASGGTITATGIVDPDHLDNTGLMINGIDYTFVDSSLSNNAWGRGSMHSGSSGGTYGVACDDTNKKVYLFQKGTSTYATYHASRVGWNSVEDQYVCRYVRDWNNTYIAFTLYGSPVNDYVSAGPTADTLSTYAGNDQVYPAGGADTVDLGAGNDVVFVNTASLTEDSSIKGGDGSDTLNFGTIFNLDGNSQSEDASVSINIAAIGNASNFENIVGTRGGNDSLTGDDNANVLIGSGGTDTLNGGSGDDTLYGDWATDDTSGATYGLRYYDVSSSSYWGDDVLNGGDGDDILVGNGGDDTLNGGAGADTLTGGEGNDTFIITSSSGGSVAAAGDTITDFIDGTDAIGFDTSLTFGNLTIESSGSSTVIRNGSNYLATISGVSPSSVTAIDFQSTSTSALTRNGTPGNDVLIGGAGDDTFNGLGGSDTLIGWAGNDTFNIANKSGSYSDIVTGGAGNDILSINYSGISSMIDFTTNLTDSTLTLTDASGGTITATGIVDPDHLDNTGLMINGIDYTFVDSSLSNNAWGRGSMHSGSSGGTYGVACDDTNKKVYLFQKGTSTYATYHASRVGWNSVEDQYVCRYVRDWNNTYIAFTLYGSPVNDYVSAGPTADTLSTYAGNDQVYPAGGADTVDLGAGNDVVFVNTASLTEDSSIKGGDGSDTLNFGTIFNLDGNSQSEDASVSINIAAIGNASNFENIVGTRGGNDSLTGDDNANVLIGSGGTDTLNGGSGDDTLYGDWATDDTSGATYGLRYYDVSSSSYWGDDVLNGGDGDDILVGNGGDDTLNGGAGADTLTGGEGNDTFIIRASGGGSSISDADVIVDFDDGNDIVGMSGLNYNDVTVEQGTGDYSNHVIVKIIDTGEFLMIIQNQRISNIDDNDFSAI